MLKNIFAAIGVIFTAVKGYEAYEKYRDAVDENEFFRTNYRHSPFPGINPNEDQEQADA